MGNKFNLDRKNNIIIKPIYLKNKNYLDTIIYLKKNNYSYREFLYDNKNWWDIKYNVKYDKRHDILLYMYKLCNYYDLEDSVFNLSVNIFDKYLPYINNNITVTFIYAIVSIIISNKYIDDNILIGFHDVINRYKLKIKISDIYLVERNLLKILDNRLSLVRLDTIIYYYFDILCVEDNYIKKLKKNNIYEYKKLLIKCIEVTHYIKLNIDWINYNLLLLSLSIILFNYNVFKSNVYKTIKIKFYFNILELYFCFDYYNYSMQISNILQFLFYCKKNYKKKLK
jgi:hypothetical protein